MQRLLGPQVVLHANHLIYIVSRGKKNEKVLYLINSFMFQSKECNVLTFPKYENVVYHEFSDRT